MKKEEAPGLYLKQVEVGPMENFVYFVGSAATREVMVVDPAWQVDTLLRIAKEEDLKIRGALITHFHFDHTNGIGELLRAVNCPVYVNKEDAPHMETVSTHIKKMSDGDRIKVGDVEIELIHTPGHTPGSQCFYARNCLISGDTLFVNACGRTDMPGGDSAKMYSSLTGRLMKFEDSTILYPGHNYAEKPFSTMGEQKKTNPHLLCGSLQNFIRFQMGM